MASAEGHPDRVSQLARLARIHLDAAAARRLGADLDRIIGYVEALARLDVSGVEPTTFAIDTTNVFRPDEPTPPFPREAILSCAPEVQDGCFRVPRVVE